MLKQILEKNFWFLFCLTNITIGPKSKPNNNPFVYKFDKIGRLIKNLIPRFDSLDKTMFANNVEKSEKELLMVMVKTNRNNLMRRCRGLMLIKLVSRKIERIRLWMKMMMM